jgi:hypothetical protein
MHLPTGNYHAQTNVLDKWMPGGPYKQDKPKQLTHHREIYNLLDDYVLHHAELHVHGILGIENASQLLDMLAWHV